MKRVAGNKAKGREGGIGLFDSLVERGAGRVKAQHQGPAAGGLGTTTDGKRTPRRLGKKKR